MENISVKSQIAEAYNEVKACKENAHLWNMEAREKMKTVDTLCRTEKVLDPNFDKKAFIESLDNPADPTDPDAYLNREMTPDSSPVYEAEATA